METSIHHLAMRTTNVDRLVRFYEDAIGLRVVQRSEAHASVWLDAGGTILMIERARPEEVLIRPGALDLVAFAVSDLGAVREKLARAAIAIEAETPQTLYMRDPDGRRIGVSVYVF